MHSCCRPSMTRARQGACAQPAATLPLGFGFAALSHAQMWAQHASKSRCFHMLLANGWCFGMLECGLARSWLRARSGVHRRWWASCACPRPTRTSAWRRRRSSASLRSCCRRRCCCSCRLGRGRATLRQTRAEQEGTPLQTRATSSQTSSWPSGTSSRGTPRRTRTCSGTALLRLLLLHQPESRARKNLHSNICPLASVKQMSWGGRQ